MINWLRKQAAKHLIEKQSKPLTHSDLKYSGVDSDGLKYYTWEDMSLLPNVRRIKLHSATLFMDAKLDKDSIEQITSKIKEASEEMRTQEDPKKRSIIQAQIIAYTEELKRREEFAIPEHWYIQIAGILNVSHNENPNTWDAELHDKKCDVLRKELHSGNAFFFKSRIYAELMNLLSGMESSLQHLLTSWELDAESLKKRMDIISSFNKSETTETAKKSG